MRAEKLGGLLACAVHLKVASAGSRPRQQRSRSWTQMLERLHRRRLTSKEYENYENTNVLETERGERVDPFLQEFAALDCGPLFWRCVSCACSYLLHFGIMHCAVSQSSVSMTFTLLFRLHLDNMSFIELLFVTTGPLSSAEHTFAP